ncbi:MAG: hypothetical protein KIT25_06590 [Enhydrobacter sp.]|nr:MAG: hypothetical protein KIT25_06590 [Enhydrobacter sp.]
MIDKSDLRTAWDVVSPFVPPALGALLGLRYATHRSPRDRMVSWLLAVGAGLYLGGAVGEFYGLGPRVTGGVMFLIAMLAMELFAVLVAALRQLAADPAGAFRRWLDAWLGRGEQ